MQTDWWYSALTQIARLTPAKLTEPQVKRRSEESLSAGNCVGRTSLILIPNCQHHWKKWSSIPLYLIFHYLAGLFIALQLVYLNKY